ncbi:MAG: bacterial Ig-like domain-containing protein, partial [Candidatus Gallimonas sp.]
MKHKMIALLATTSLALAVGGITACNKEEPSTPPVEIEPEIVAISAEMTNDGIFTVGDTFERETLRIYAVYDDGSREIVATDDCSFEMPDLTSEGKKTLTVSYEGFSDTLDLWVYYGVTFDTAYKGADAAAPDAEWLIYNSGTRNSDGYRYADNAAYWTYRFTTEEGKRFADATLSLTLSNEYLVSVSTDNETWMEMAQGGTGADRTENNAVTLNLKDDFNRFSENHGTLYVRFSDANPADGFGPILKAFRFYYISETDPNPPEKEPETVTHDFSIVCDGTEDAAWLFGNSGSKIWNGGDEGLWRYADEHASWSYAFDLGQKVKTLSVSVLLRFQQKIEASFDTESWTEIANELAGGDWLTKTFTLTVPEENDGRLFLRFSDANPDDGFGISVKNVGLRYTVSDEQNFASP